MSSTRLTLRLRAPASQKLQLGRPPCSTAPAPAKPHTRSFTEVTSVPSQPRDAFTSTLPPQRPEGHTKDYRPPDERTLKLGKTLRTLQPLLPTLLQTPLPTSILSPQITLHLFPSTHPHLPVVHGRVAYMAALWTSPLAWGRVPLIGNVRLDILSERMVKISVPPPSSSVPAHEQLVVRWRTIGRASLTGALRKSIGAQGRTEVLGQQRGVKAAMAQGDEDEFTGLFIFEFDEEGRIVKHVIEHVQEIGVWEKGVGARVVGLADWLLGRMNKDVEGERSVAPCCVRC